MGPSQLPCWNGEVQPGMAPLSIVLLARATTGVTSAGGALCDSRIICKCLALAHFTTTKKSFLQPNGTNPWKGREATGKLLENRGLWYQSWVLTLRIPNAGGLALGKRPNSQSLFLFVNTCSTVLGIKEITGDLAVAGRQKFKITPCPLLFFICEIAKNVPKPQKEAQEIYLGVFRVRGTGPLSLRPCSHPPHRTASGSLSYLSPCLPGPLQHTHPTVNVTDTPVDRIMPYSRLREREMYVPGQT